MAVRMVSCVRVDVAVPEGKEKKSEAESGKEGMAIEGRDQHAAAV
jgi:hypothetical protein